MTYQTYPLTDVQPAVDTADLAKWLSVELADPLLPMIGRMATSAAIDFLQRELLYRDRRVVYQQWPIVGTLTPGISKPTACLRHDIALPYAQLLTVKEVTVYGEETLDYSVLYTAPASIRLSPAYNTAGDSETAIDVLYTAGFGDYPSSVPQGIRDGIMCLAAFMYEHRGACDANDAMMKSGAMQLLQPYRFYQVLL